LEGGLADDFKRRWKGNIGESGTADKGHIINGGNAFKSDSGDVVASEIVSEGGVYRTVPSDFFDQYFTLNLKIASGI
jgi:hypothetical protein